MTTIAAPDQEQTLGHVCTALTRVVASSEDDFMALGMNLQRVQTMSSASRKKIAAAMALFKGEGDEDVLARITDYVQGSQEQTTTAQQTAVDLCERLAGMLVLIDAIAGKSRVLEKSGLFLRVVGINTGIECARYSELESTFKVVAEETVHLSEQVAAATEVLQDKAAGARQEQTRTLEQARGSISGLEQLVAGTGTVTQTALAKVAELIDYSVAVVNKAEQTAAAVTAEINQVVMGIQFHDNLRQRIEHVTEALEEIEDPATLTEERQLGQACLMMELQKSQLDNLVVELGELYSTQTRALGNIIDEVAHLKARLQDVAAEQSSGRQEDTPLVALQQGISALQELNHDSATLGTTIRASAARAEQVVDDMQEAIRNTYTVTIHIKMNALNAIIKAAQSGQSGMALQVLAQSMVAVSNDTRELVTAFEELIVKLQQLAQGHADNAASQQLETPAGGGFDSDQMEQVFVAFHGQLQQVKSDCAELEQALAREQQKLAFIQRLKDALQQATDLLSEQIESLPEVDADLMLTLRQDFGRDIQARYTMEKERTIYHQVKQGTRTATPAGDTGATGSMEPDVAVDLWDETPSGAASSMPDNSELWGADTDPDPAGGDSELWGTDTAATADNAELWDSAPAASDSPATADADGVDLWDDVAPAPTADGLSADEGIDLWDGEPAVQPREDSSAADGVELWDDAPADGVDESDEGKQGTKKIKKDQDFGDNVELF